jgi:Domain of Unknown Function (DUF1080)
MARCGRLASWTVALGLLLPVPACQRPTLETTGPPSTPAASPPTTSGWRNLFDGTSLSGWQTADFFDTSPVGVKDGAIQLPKGKPMAGATYTRGDFPKMDYEVTFEARKIDGTDFFCTTTFPVGDSFCSLVVGGWSGTVVGLSNIDFMDASMNETRSDREFQRGQWYRLRLRVSPKRIEAWIDRDQVVDLDTTDRQISIRIECEACKPFGIATYDTSGAVRDIRIRPLSPSEKKALAERKPERN